MNYLINRFSKLSVTDLLLTNASKFVTGLLFGALFAPVIKKRKRWIVLLSVIFAVKPLYSFFLKDVKPKKNKSHKVLDEEEMLFV